MKTFLRLRSSRFPFFAATALTASALVFAPAAQSAGNDRSDQPPLELKIDEKPIDRKAADRVSYAPIVERTAGSVVYVYSTKQVRRAAMPPFFDDPRFQPFFDQPGNRRNRLPDRTQQGLGSGVIISSNGYILTNNHVVEGADEVKVSIGESNRRYDANVIGSDALADVAVLRIDADARLQPATLGDSDQLEVGDTVLAIGNPFGVGQSVSQGIVSALSRGNLGIEAIEDFIQTDAAINPGNSGGALVDTSGRVVGINTAILSRTGGFAGVGFAVPINLARAIAEQIVRTGRVTRGFLGVAPQTLSPELATEFGTDRGALVAEVTPDSAAEKAGLEAGDIITKINQVQIRDPRQLLLVVSQLAPETEVTVEYLRDGETHTATATLARRPDELAANDNSDDTSRGVLDGVSVSDLTPEARQRFQIPQDLQGAVVTAVSPDSAAARQGLREGDVIQSLNRKSVQNASEAIRLSGDIEGPQVLVRLWRQGRSQFVVIDESEK